MGASPGERTGAPEMHPGVQRPGWVDWSVGQKLATYTPTEPVLARYNPKWKAAQSRVNTEDSAISYLFRSARSLPEVAGSNPVGSGTELRRC